MTEKLPDVFVVGGDAVLKELTPTVKPASKPEHTHIWSPEVDGDRECTQCNIKYSEMGQPDASSDRLLTDEIKEILIQSFVQTVEYGAICSECCSSQGGGDKVLCEMSEKPLQPDDYCPQQLACIDNLIPQIIAKTHPLAFEAGKKQGIKELAEWVDAFVSSYFSYIKAKDRAKLVELWQAKLKKLGL